MTFNSLGSMKQLDESRSNFDDESGNEATILKELNHSNIIKYYDNFVQKSVFYLVTEYCNVCNLD